ncbi:O-methyltransferase [Jeongeupia naejangsanensis]|uniref:Class I SAM-dependent methyltransferase n=1 Tax=Jeongeupia naejangsanensis TaxID=613195 RepID=A0ABS2BP89_9NEIS|nr:class I SAM-dependent methyltransferase [Jeongeupia naejangsanensis]MBM3117444.1 class I SAM-dependent methyltransferase [Jeongeupia naejangsanensis]
MTRQTLSLDPALVGYVTAMQREPEALARLRAATAGHRLARMQLAPEQGQLLMLLLQLTGARRYLEVGTYTGYSAMAAALAMGETGRVTACDVSDAFTRIARAHWQAAGVAGRIELVLQPALRTLDALLDDGQAGAFDCMLIDADKPGYPDYYERALRLVRPGGLILLDNMLLGGDVARPHNEEAPGVGVIRDLNAALRDDARVAHCFLPLGDGLIVLMRR